MNKIITTMDQVKAGNLDVRIDITDDKDELNYIATQFNDMCIDLKNHIEISYLAEMNKKEAELSKKKAEMLSLQSKINPHFLYNTLESIRMKAIANGNRDVGRMLFLLGNLFRNQLKEDDVITIEKEINYCKEYLELFKFRYDDKFNYYINCEQELLNKEIILIENNKILELRELLEEYHIIDIFEIMENLEENEKIKLFEVLPLDMAASILEESDVEFFSNILSKLDKENKKNILELMSLDDMADILSQLEEDERENIMELLSEKDADDVKELLIYEEESTGGIMTTGYIQINEYMTAKEAISHMREYAEDAETIYYVYVVDNEERLVGVLSLRELILARDSSIVKDLMSENIISVFVDEDREEAVRLVSKYNLIAIPVIDREHRLKGIITVDDIIDVMEEEATEDMYKFAGTSEHEIDIAQNVNKTATEQIFSSVRARIPWLIITLLAGLLSSAILSNLDFIMNPKYASLVFFIPVVLGMGGNIGTQSSALAVMSLSNKDLEFNNVIREAVVGIITGIICSLIVSIIVFIFIKDINIVLVVTVSLFINMIVGAMIGGFMPILFKKLDADPSIISAPVIATVLDITGITIYLVTTTIILSKIV